MGPGGCRFCGAALSHTFVDLGMSPLCESYLSADRLDEPEPVYPLRAFVCDRCFLVQLPAHVGGEEIFTEYAYFSSYSDSWLAHAERYTDAMIARFGLDGTSQVVEVASNDGYLLQYFVRRGIPSLGIEPAANVAAVAAAKGIPTLVEFFGRTSAARLVARGIQADLIAGNNVLAQVPDVNDFVAGLAMVLRTGAVLTLEFPHLMRLVEENQFDTIYHEHYSYFSLLTVEAILGAHGMAVFDVETLPTHGARSGSSPATREIRRIRSIANPRIQRPVYDRRTGLQRREDAGSERAGAAGPVVLRFRAHHFRQRLDR